MNNILFHSGAWAVLPQELVALGRRIKKAEAAPRINAALPSRPEETWFGDPIPKLYEIDGTQVVTASGVLVSGAAPSDKYFGGICDYADLQADLMAAAQKSDNIILNIRSGGGMVMGMVETCALIESIAQSKSVIAFIDGLGCSAAYALACNCSMVCSTPTAYVGSIGSIISMPNISRMWDAMGVDWKTFSSGDMKSAGDPNTPMSAEHELFFEELVDDTAEEFRAMVGAKRQSVDDSSMRGQFFVGAKAMALGFVDQLANSLDDVADIVSCEPEDDDDDVL